MRDVITRTLSVMSSFGITARLLGTLRYHITPVQPIRNVLLAKGVITWLLRQALDLNDSDVTGQKL